MLIRQQHLHIRQAIGKCTQAIVDIRERRAVVLFMDISLVVRVLISVLVVLSLTPFCVGMVRGQRQGCSLISTSGDVNL